MTEALVLRNLSKTYRNGFQALKGIDLTVQEGDFYALLGPNGAGKSTTIGIISSLVHKTTGTVRIFGHDIDTHLSQAKQQLGVVPQEFNFGQFEKVFDILVTQAGYYGIPAALGRERAEKYLRKLGLWEKRDAQARMLSGGMKRRLMIARAMVHEPRLLILDEPTAGVDIELRRSMWDFLTELNGQGVTIILTTHYLEEAEMLCRHIAIIDKGIIVEDTDMKSLLGKLQVEHFLLDLREPLAAAPQLEGYAVKQLDDRTLEVAVAKSQSLNAVFTLLSAQGIEVMSLRNRANRLEELFVSMVEKNLKTA
jgi:ABC-2 type transport system ATP-binding protein